MHDLAGGQRLDAFFAVFGTVRTCAAAAIAIQQAVARHVWPAGERVRVRISMHSGEAEQTAVGLVGMEVHHAARISAVAHGGQILVSAAAAVLLSDALPDGASLRNLGWHRLKDLGRAEQTFQLDAPGLPTAFPPLRSLDNPQLPNNLSTQASSFIGRDVALAEVSGLVTASRLVTLTGAGGVGKTRLALQVAAATGARSANQTPSPLPSSSGRASPLRPVHAYVRIWPTPSRRPRTCVPGPARCFLAPRGQAYRALVTGTRAHTVHMLRSVRRLSFAPA